MQFLAEHICFSWDRKNSSFTPSCRWYKTKGQNKKAQKNAFFKEEFTSRSQRKAKNIAFWWRALWKSSGAVMLVGCVQTAKDPRIIFGGERKQDWDTIQRMRVVLQRKREKKKTHEKGVDTPPPIHLREGFLNHSSGHQMVLQRQVWSMRCWSRQGGWRNEEAEGHLASR